MRCEKNSKEQRGNLALRSGRKIEWDSKKMKVINVPEANQFITKTYRKGWEI